MQPDDSELIDKLEAEGHEAAAKQVRDTRLARELEAAGHTELAAKLKGEKPPEAERTLTAEESNAASFAETLNELQGEGWIECGKMLGRRS